MSKTRESDWVVAGGAPGEAGHCQRCGAGLSPGFPIDPSVFCAAWMAFVKVHSKCQDRGRVEPKPRSVFEWAKGRDVGISSGTIYTAFTYQPTPCSRFGVPHDIDDFGCCYRFLKLFPDARHSLPDTVVLCPAWEPFLECWDELTALYEQGLSSGTNLLLYERIRGLVDAGRKKKGLQP